MKTTRKCKAEIDGVKCGVRFQPRFDKQFWCCDEHHDIFFKSSLIKIRAKNARTEKREASERQKKERKAYAKRKAALKPKNTKLSEAQKAFNDYIRYRDKYRKCINTGVNVSWDGNESDAAHFISRAANNAMRFDLRNVHKATKASNKNQEKYIHDYRVNLIERLGTDRFDQFEADCKYWRINKRNFSEQYLERVKVIFRRKKRILMKLRGDKNGN